MIGLSIEFLAGRYHATPWDHQVNEGVVEWPPSPWRILRALVSASYRMVERPERSLLIELFTQLAEELPSYHLPRYTAAHTRHYMPLVNEGKWTTAKVIDTFHALEGGAADPATLQVVWPVVLGEELRSLLGRLCAQVSYLGRAESWVEMTLLAADVVPREANASVGLVQEQGATQSRVLAPLDRSGLEGFRSALGLLPAPKGKGKKAWRAPADILAVLELDVGELHRQGWSGVPGARWVSYGVSSARPIARELGMRSGSVPTIARFALAGSVLPKLTQAVSVGERFRQALMAWSRDENGLPARVFSGKESAEEPDCREGQGHAWYLPEVNERGRIDHVVVFAAEGFGEELALRALGRLGKVWGSEGFDIKTVLVSLGQVDPGASSWEVPCFGVVGSSKIWRSLTPMVLARHPKAKKLVNKAGEVVGYKTRYVAGTGFQLDGPEDQALRSLGQLPHLGLALGGDRFSVPAEDDGGDWLAIPVPGGCAKGAAAADWVVRVRCGERGAYERFSWLQFQRQRHHGDGRRAGGQGYWLELEFRAAVSGPIALGYGAHFGLGVFVPVG